MANNAPRDQNNIPALLGTSNVDGTPVTIYADPVTHRLLVNSPVSANVLTATGSVDGTNKVFTFTSKPSFIVSDGLWYRQTDDTVAANVLWSWVGGTLTATMTIAPTSILFGIL